MEKEKPEVYYKIFEVGQSVDVLSRSNSVLLDSYLSKFGNFDSFDKAMEKIENDGEPLTTYTILPIIRCPLK